MKNYLFLPVLMSTAVLLVASCNRAELDQSKHSNDSLLSVVSDREAALNEFISSFNEVEQNLDSVAARQHIITVHTDQKGELKQDQKERINAQIAAINNLMDENRQKLDELNKKLKNSAHKNVQLEKLIVTLKNQLSQKDIELASLNEKLNSLNAEVAQLQTTVTSLTIERNLTSQALDEATVALHTAYYIVGKTSELQDAKIIDRKGGLLGIGKTSKLSENFDNSKFTRIDYTQTLAIPVNSEMKIITSHPGESYTLEKDATNKDKVKFIVISNPDKFWSASKYLVIVKD
jgi:DNA repair exonuclease SbcCD ATPase subunit